MVPKLGNKVSRALSGSSLAGDGMLIRLRSSTLAILGLVAAVGLGLIGFASLQGWPAVLSAPLPQEPGPEFVRNDPIVAPAVEVGGGTAAARLAAGPTPEGRRARRSRGTGSGGASALTAAREVDSATAQPQPVSVPEPSPASSPPAPAAGDAQPVASPAQSVEPAPATARPSSSSGDSAPVAAAADRSPGKSGDDHGHDHGAGPPAWAGPDKAADPPGHSSADDDAHGK